MEPLGASAAKALADKAKTAAAMAKEAVVVVFMNFPS
jgi:hypothetical protein